MTDRQELSEQNNYAWLVWGVRVGEHVSSPLGCYASREVALEAERMCREHENAPFWSDFWVTPWPLETEPRLNFRMGMLRPPAVERSR